MRSQSVVLVGIAGGVATGKTTVGKLFEEQGANLIEADGIGWLLLEDQEIKERLIGAFGKDILNFEGEVERKKLGRIVFSSPEARETLNSIVHPVLLQRLREKIGELKKAGFEGVVAVVAALIPEWEIKDWFDELIVVTCPEKVALERLMKQGFTEREARDRVGSQLPVEEKVKEADFIIENNGDLAKLTEEARKVWEEITQSHTPLS